MRRPKCPCCGHEVDPTVVLISLHASQIAYAGNAVLANPFELKLLNTLKKKMPHYATHAAIHFAIWGGRPPRYSAQQLTTRLAQLRHKLEPLGLRILSEQGKGYRLVRVGLDVEPLPETSPRRAAA